MCSSSYWAAGHQPTNHSWPFISFILIKTQNLATRLVVGESYLYVLSPPPHAHLTRAARSPLALQLVSEQEALHAGQVEHSGDFLRSSSNLVSIESGVRFVDEPIGLFHSQKLNLGSFWAPFGLRK